MTGESKAEKQKSEIKVIHPVQKNGTEMFDGDAYANNRKQFSTQGKFHIKASTKQRLCLFCISKSPGDTRIREFRPSRTKQTLQKDHISQGKLEKVVCVCVAVSA